MSTKKSTAKNPPKTPKKKPASKAPSKAAIRRQEIAKKTLEGKTETQIAEDLGMSRDGVKDAKEHPEFPATLSALLAPHQARYESLFNKSLVAIEELLEPGQPQTSRLAAIDRVLRIVEMQQPKGPAVAVNVGVSIEQLEQLVRGSK